MPRRRTPAWLTEATAWSAGLVLVAAVAVVGSGVITTRTTTTTRTEALGTQPETPVVTAPVVVPQPVATVAPKPVVTSRAPAVPAESSLGPPPGPQFDARPDRVAAPADRYALVVGVTRYRAPTHPTIAGANDANYIAGRLLAAGWLPDNVHVLTEGQATGANIRSELAWLASKGAAGTFTYFHFSGHVKQEGGHEKLWPVDRDFVPDTAVAATLHRIQGHLWMDIAGCEAGGFMEDLPSDRVLVSTSSERTQKSYEYPQWGESVWSGLVYDLGSAQGQADADHDGRVTIGEALRFATYYAQSITLRQTPYGRQTPQVAGDGVRGWTLADPPA